MFQRRWVRDITGAPTLQVLYKYVELWEMLDEVNLQHTISDRFVWKWTFRPVYCLIGLLLLLHQENDAVGCKRTPEFERAAEGQILPLACHSR